MSATPHKAQASREDLKDDLPVSNSFSSASVFKKVINSVFVNRYTPQMSFFGNSGHDRAQETQGLPYDEIYLLQNTAGCLRSVSSHIRLLAACLQSCSLTISPCKQVSVSSLDLAAASSSINTTFAFEPKSPK